MTEGEPRPVGRTLGRRLWGTWPRRVTGVVLVLVVGLGVVVGVDEHRRPGVFFDLVGARVWWLSDAYGDREVSVANRLYMGEVARQIYLWDGVQRVAWPDIFTADGDRAVLDPQIGVLTVVLEPEAVSEIGPYVARALEVCRSASEHGLDLRISLHSGSHVLDVRDEDPEVVQTWVDYFHALVEDPETSSARLLIGNYVPQRSDREPLPVPFVLLWPSDGVDGDSYLVRWKASAVDHGLAAELVVLKRP